MDTEDTDSAGIPSSTTSRKRKRESLSERRLKGRSRKRRKRANLPPLQRQAAGNSTSSSDNGNDVESARFPTRKFFPYNPEAMERLQHQVVAAGRPNPHTFREFTSVVPVTGNSSCSDSAGQPGGVSDAEGGDLTAADNDEETERNQNGNRKNAVGPSNNDRSEEADVEDAIANPDVLQSDGESVPNQGNVNAGSGTEDNRNPRDEDAAAVQTEASARNPHGNVHEEERLLKRQLESMTDLERLAIDAAGVRGSSCATNSSIDKMFAVVFKHMETVRKLQGRRNKKKTYSKCLRRMALKHTPKVTTDLLVEAKTPEGVIEYLRVEGLDAIPEKYRRIGSKGSLRVIREESSVSLQSIKEHHERVHVQKGESLESVRKQYRNCILSLDGVEESKSGSKKFHVGSIKIGDCIYPYKVYDFLMGHEAAKVSTSTMIG